MRQTGLEKNRRTLVRDYKMVQVENMIVPFLENSAVQM
jgi:hypothetical protein